MTYMKLITDRAKRHLVLPGQGPGGFATLCGCTVTRAGNWRLITALEGDECKKCADLSFSLRRSYDSLESSDCDFGQRTNLPPGGPWFSKAILS
jgi:hypothetical protein